MKLLLNSLLSLKHTAITLISTCLLAYTCVVVSAPLEGLYQTLNPERGRNGQPTQKIFMKKADMQGQEVVVVVGCNPGCTPVIYSYIKEQSATLGRDIYFSKAGIYLFNYDDNTFVTAIPDAQLGMKEWHKLMFVNVYSKEGQSLNLDQQTATEFVLQQSKQIMNTGTLEKQQRGSGNYHIASPIKVLGKSHETASIELLDSPQKKIVFQACEKCPADTFTYLADESALTGTGSYINRQGHIIFDVKDGVLIWANFDSNYGKKVWDKYNSFNVYAKDIGYIRSIRAEKGKQDAVDKLMSEYAQIVKLEMDRRQQLKTEQQVANQQLPQQGLTDDELQQQITAASERWAKRWDWKETITYSYFLGVDWRVKYHPLTGLVTGRHIAGVIVMKRPDGLCSFHSATFGQDYDGSNFVSTHMVGLSPGQIKLSCDKT